MNFEFYIAKKLINSNFHKNSVSAPIIKIGIAAISVSTIVMLIALAVSNGLQIKIRDKAVAFNGHITITNFDSNSSEGSNYPLQLNQSFYPKFNNIEGIKHIQGVAQKFGIIRTEKDFEGLFIKGVGEDYDWKYFRDFLVNGRLPVYSNLYSNEVLISKYLADRLNFSIEDSFQMYFLKSDSTRPPSIIKFNVVGIFNSGFAELDQTFLIGDINHIQRLNKWSNTQVGQFEVFIDDYDLLEKKGLQIYNEIPSHLDSQTIVEKYPVIFEWISIFDKNTFGIIVMMIFVGMINMITALLVLILERTKMIGVLKSLGCNNWSIQKVFIYMAGHLITYGLLIGNAIGLILLFIQKYYSPISLNPSIYYVSNAPVEIDIFSILYLNLSIFCICIFVMLLPSYLVSKISPVKAIRFDS